MSVLQVDKIQDAAGTTNKELAEYSSSAWSWGAGCPAGTIIQTVVVKKDDENSASLNSGSLTKFVDSGGNADFRATINNVTSGNDIIVTASFTVRVGHTQDQHGIALGFLRDTGTPSNSGGTAVYESTSGHAQFYLDARGAFGGGSGDVTHYGTPMMQFVDTNVSGTSFNYYLGGDCQNAGSGVIVRADNPPNFPFYMTLQEVKR